MARRITVRGAKETASMLETKRDRIQRNLNNAIHKAGFKLEADIKESIAGRKT